MRKDELGARFSAQDLRDIGLVRAREFDHAVLRYESTFAVFERSP